MELKKHNPLFLDSTQPVGDKLITNVELLDASLAPGESLYLEVTDSFGVQQKFALKTVATKKSVRHSAELWLNQNEQIKYRFLLISAGAELLSTAEKTALAGGAISEKWDPATTVKASAAPKAKKATPKAPKSSEIKKNASIKSQGLLGTAQDYQQMKFLLGELE
ncbi:hypothetical protein EP01_07905 [Bdellovibrio bacteriovorus]|uniref:hypothetical protein n=1 Tax=Bdellovibrio bacteriovorus TaxID=959 RepID=UPI00045BE1DE|nr:hypothetical protein [Bdellovibrio bacteriovorus]AHZ84859.1 hypothetical protein EP01_07905 [Bdellovibrio bacteriovorus]